MWFLTDSVRFDMLKGFSPTDMGSRSRYLYENYHVLVQECARDEFEAVQAELTAIMEEQQTVPDAIIIHCGVVYIGDARFKRQTIQKKIITEFEKCLEEINAKIMGNCKVIWSRMVTEPMDSIQFTPQAIYGCTTSVNSGAAAELHSKGVGIIKHSNIELNAHNFHKSGHPKYAAKIQFLMDIDTYMREHSQSVNATAMSKLPVQWIDNTMQLQIKEARDKQKQLTNRITELQKIVEEVRQTPVKKRKQRQDQEAARKCRDARRALAEHHQTRSRSRDRNEDEEISRPHCCRQENTRDFQARCHDNFARNRDEVLFQQFMRFEQFRAGVQNFGRGRTQRFGNPRHRIDFF